MGLEEIKLKTAPALSRHKAEFAAVFGSYARGEERADSDVDILVRFSEAKSLLDLIGLEQELEEVLQKRVDLVTEKGLSPFLKPSILKDLKPIYGSR